MSESRKRRGDEGAEDDTLNLGLSLFHTPVISPSPQFEQESRNYMKILSAVPVVQKYASAAKSVGCCIEKC